MSFSGGFATGYQAGEALRRRKEEERIKEEMAAIGSAVPEEVTTPTMAPVDPSGADPGATSGETKATRFLGKTYDKPMTDGDVMNARTMAMSGVLMKNGNPEGGLRLQQQAMQGQRDAYRFGREQKNDVEADAEKEKSRAYDDEVKNAYRQTKFAQIETEHSKAVEKYQRDLAEYQKRVSADGAGPKAGLPPQEPVKPSYTMADAIGDTGKLVATQARHGKVNPAELMRFGEMLKNVEQEGIIQATQLAQSGAPLAEVIKSFNAQGKEKIDPAAIVSDTFINNSDGVKTRVVQIRNPDGSIRTLDTLATLKAFGKGKEEYEYALKKADDARADKALDATIRHQRVMEGQSGAGLGIRQAQIAKADAKEKATAQAAADIFLEQNPGATPAQIEAVRRGVLPAIPQRGEIKSEFKPDQYGGSGTAVQYDRAGNIVVTKVDAKGQPVGTSTIPAPGSQKAGPAAPHQFKSFDEVEAAAASGKIKAGDSVMVGGRRGTYQPNAPTTAAQPQQPQPPATAKPAASAIEGLTVGQVREQERVRAAQRAALEVQTLEEKRAQALRANRVAEAQNLAVQIQRMKRETSEVR
jgi:hypothetical protein